MKVELNEELDRAWVDGVEQAVGTFMVVSVQTARDMGVVVTTPVPPGVEHVFICTSGFSFLEKTKHGKQE